MPPQIRVQPGDLITADLINTILERLEALENKPKEIKETKEKDTDKVQKDTDKVQKDTDKPLEKAKDVDKPLEKAKDVDKPAEKAKDVDKPLEKATDKPAEGRLPVLGVPGGNGRITGELTPVPTEPDMVVDQPAQGRAFIRREERPLVGQRVLDEPGDSR